MPLESLYSSSFHSHRLEAPLSALSSSPLRQSPHPVTFSLSLLPPSGHPEFHLLTPPLTKLGSSTHLDCGVLQTLKPSSPNLDLTTSNPLSDLLLSLCSLRGSLSTPAPPRHAAVPSSSSSPPPGEQLLRHCSKGFGSLDYFLSRYL